MKNIKFTINQNKGVRTGTVGSVLALSEINLLKLEGLRKENLPLMQLFTSGYRVAKTNLNWKDWNGCVYVDIDSKNYIEIDNINIDILEKQLVNYLSADLWDNFYCEQRSASGNSFHFFFYFDCDKNESNFKCCVSYAMDKVKEAFEVCGYKGVVNTQGVLDKCVTSCIQGVYVTSNKFIYNTLTDEISGSIDKDILESYKSDDEVIYNATEIKFESKDVKFKSNPKCDLTDWHNENRRRLITILAKYFNGNKDEAYKCFEWAYDNIFGKYITNHTREEVLNLFNLHFNNIYRNNYLFHHKMLEFCKENFGMKFSKTFKPKKISNIKYDEIIDLGNDTLTEKIFDIYQKPYNLIHITAGCGFGKTYAAKSLTKLSMFEDDIDLLFSGLSKFNIRICFVTPMTSINRDNFDDEKNWKIIDGEHNDINKNDIVNSNCPICTTWTSFLNYEMYNKDFDIFIFDEIHSLYLYDYRTEIKDIKKYIKILGNKHKKVIMMTGTPSNELSEFDCYKIKVNKNTQKVNCDVVFYKKNWKGYIVEDIKKWTSESKDNLVAIFNDMANINTKLDYLDNYGIKIDTLYNKRNVSDIDYVIKNHMFRGQIMLCSVYGQAGINIIIPEHKKVRIYILNTCGMSVIQYANRIRNKECIDKIVIPYMNENISNSIVNINTEIELDNVYRILEEKNKLNPIENEIICSKRKDLINIKLGLHTYYTHYNEVLYKWEIDDDEYKTYELIKRTQTYERQTQILYNRLIEANFDVNFIYLDKDVEDKHITDVKRKNRFVGKMLEFTDEWVKQKNNGTYYIDTKGYDLHQYISDNDKYNIEYILNYLGSNNANDVIDKFKEVINLIFKKNETFTKIDLRRWAKIYQIKQNYGLYVDDWYLKQIINGNDDIKKLTATYVTMLFDYNPTDDILYKTIDDVYNGLNELKYVVKKFEWLVDGNLVSDEEDNYINLNKNNNSNIDSIRKNIYSKTVKYINEKHTPKNKDNKDKCKKVEINGVVYDSVKIASEQLNKNKRTILRWLSENKAKYL